MSVSQRGSIGTDALVYVRLGHDSRLQCVSIEMGSTFHRADIVLVADVHGRRHPARIVGECQHSAEEAIFGQVVAGYNVDATAASTLTEVLGGTAVERTRNGGHRWGALGLPFGPESPVSPADQELETDAVFATTSRGFREVDAAPIHQLVPGDFAVFRGSGVMVNAIDRRKDRVELVSQQDQSIVDVPLTTFLEETERT